MFLIHQLEKMALKTAEYVGSQRKCVSFVAKYVILNGPIFSTEKRNSAPSSHNTKLYHDHLSQTI